MFKTLILSGIIAGAIVSSNPALPGSTNRDFNPNIESNKIETKVDQNKYIQVADMPLYKGEIQKITKTDKGISLLVSENGKDKSMENSMIFHVNNDTKINIKLENLKVGDMVDIFHSPIVARSFPGQTAAIAINVINYTIEQNEYIQVADMPLYNGKIQEIIKTDRGISLLVSENSKDNSMIFHISDNTKFNVELESLKVGDNVDIFHSLAVTNSLPGQTSAIAVNLVN